MWSSGKFWGSRRNNREILCSIELHQKERTLALRIFKKWWKDTGQPFSANFQCWLISSEEYTFVANGNHISVFPICGNWSNLAAINAALENFLMLRWFSYTENVNVIANIYLWVRGIFFSQMTPHISDVCPCTVITCEYEHVGCKQKVTAW